jgi:hypothetical protein
MGLSELEVPSKRGGRGKIVQWVSNWAQFPSALSG